MLGSRTCDATQSRRYGHEERAVGTRVGDRLRRLDSAVEMDRTRTVCGGGDAIMEDKHVIMRQLEEIRGDVGTIKNIMVLIAIVVLLGVTLSVCSVLGALV